MWVLASASPRRRDLLAMCGAHFTVDPSHYVEDNAQELPADLTIRQAAGKALDVARRRGDGVPVLGADTVVVHDERILGKPRDREEARRMLSELSGDWHEVWTGMALVTDCDVATAAVCTRVHMRVLDEAELTAYLAGSEWRDKAGAYGIQGRAAMFTDRIDGSYTNVVGLPMAELKLLLAEKGVVW